ncbi:MAG TPA: CPBP family intramembrane glutamic endopeptidase [Candidatus Acidoferrum sp.]|nr:CPBP family intramembrane glutamic endopeptidase [Candidatus Acidoferrum sp.]
MTNRFLLSLEFLIFFLGLPLLIYYRVVPDYPIPYLLLAALIIFLLLHRDPTFELSRLISTQGIARNLPKLLFRDAIFLLLLGIAVRVFAPDLLFSLIKRSPAFWALIMLLYPLLSVFPQELLYRAFFFHRYRSLFGSGWGMILASALAFGFVHIIFGNWLSVGLCVIGGFLFSLTYQRSGSLLLACIDHALFGNFIFTIGLGRFFYHAPRL